MRRLNKRRAGELGGESADEALKLCRTAGEKGDEMTNEEKWRAEFLKWHESEYCGTDSHLMCDALPLEGGAYLAACRAHEAEIEALRAFADYIIDEYSLEIEGVQDIAVDHGLLTAVNVTEPCGPDCRCAEYGFPAACYRKTALLKGE